MASKKTLELRAWRLEAEAKLKGRWFWKHPLTGKGTPYRRGMENGN